MSNTSSLCGKPDDDVSRRSWTVKDWYTHVGAWVNATGQLCFGSTMAFSAMLTQFHRVHTTIARGDGGWIGIKRFMVSDLFGLQESPQGPLTHHHHVTRLQAEVSALQQRLNAADQRVDDLQSELNKARDMVRWFYTHANVHQVGTAMMDAAREFLAAPAEDVRAVGEERTTQDYAIEHAGFLATAADQVLADYQAYSLAHACQ